ncbi:hypothetical protein PAXRUDRAFT_684620 [Paxillus rubicundulus Ve08.2h10]|uniref:Uncharacterized protein n=1 Tax=Paxillus rubicundulus Ve08.2h10 TaxID=930991 RepID=A0A0D0E314_9AGAM|nr:hypothetical protein PAXRUDRAFT_684620 [Paxillus rubicundulus Ve08.2h10]
MHPSSKMQFFHPTVLAEMKVSMQTLLSTLYAHDPHCTRSLQSFTACRQRLRIYKQRLRSTALTNGDMLGTRVDKLVSRKKNLPTFGVHLPLKGPTAKDDVSVVND